MGVLKCIVYIAATGIVAFALGRLAPKSWFHADAFPFRTYEWENKVWKAIRIKRWQAKLPDMSRIMDFFFPNNKVLPLKRITEDSLKNLPLMIQETCVSELTHSILCFSGLAMLWIYPGWLGAAITFVYIFVGNVPFVLIQRFNRPRLEKALAQQDARKARMARRLGRSASVAGASVPAPRPERPYVPVIAVAQVSEDLLPDIFRANAFTQGALEALELGG